MNMAKPVLLGLAALTLAAPLAARDSLGVFSDWGAFRDPDVPRCYAIAKAAPSRMQRDNDPYASIGTWPRRQIRNQLHFRVSRNLAADPKMSLKIGGRTFTLTGAGGNAWAQNRRMDAAIVAAMRSAGSMTLSATDNRGRRFSNTYDLDGVATAMDAATVACASLGR